MHFNFPIFKHFLVVGICPGGISPVGICPDTKQSFEESESDNHI